MNNAESSIGVVSKVGVRLTVNGEVRQSEVDPRIPLVQMLRDGFGLTGTRFGCLTGYCGACTVVLNGQIVKSCTVLAASADGDEVLTVEGLAQDSRLHPIQQAFWDEQGFQCGYCTPGMIMAALELLTEKHNPSDDEVRAGISGNLCRCTGYHSIVKAIRTAAETETPARQ
jgi:aerobic carbon-monoxide dehydrogenase small subunit